MKTIFSNFNFQFLLIDIYRRSLIFPEVNIELFSSFSLQLYDNYKKNL